MHDLKGKIEKGLVCVIPHGYDLNIWFLGPEFASRRAEHSLLWRMSLYNFDIPFLLPVCVIIVLPLRFSWLLVLGLYKEDYLQIFKYVSFWLHGFCGKWEGWDPVNRFNHTSWVAIVTPTDRPKSVHNRCVIEVFGGVFVLTRCFLDFSVGVGAFVIGLSQISSLFS